jgi:hypothetical protein
MLVIWAESRIMMVFLLPCQVVSLPCIYKTRLVVVLVLFCFGSNKIQ